MLNNLLILKQKYSYASNIYAKYMEAKDELLFDSLIDQYRSLAQRDFKLNWI